MGTTIASWATGEIGLTAPDNNLRWFRRNFEFSYNKPETVVE
jgi:hypothetical protein